MSLRKNGVIGGPRRTKPIKPKVKPGFFPKANKPQVIVLENEVEAFVLPSKEEYVPLSFTETEEKPELVEVFEIDPIKEEDKDPSLEELFPVEVPVVDKLTCDICGTKLKSKKGLKSHKKWKHSITEDV